MEGAPKSLSRVGRKTRFSMVPEDQSLSTWGDGGLCDSFVLMGLEAHVCVQQTALDLLAMGKQVYLAVDCITSQRALDRETAVERLKQAGAIVTTSESVMFELMRAKEHPHFKALQATPSQLCLLPIMCRRPALPSPPACCGVHPILISLPLPRGSSRSSRRRRCAACRPPARRPARVGSRSDAPRSCGLREEALELRHTTTPWPRLRFVSRDAWG